MPLTKDELFRRIRSDAVLEELSIRALARKHGVHRRLVREALTSAEPTPRRQPVRRSPRLDPVKKTIDEWLRADLEAPRKQRHTARRIKDRLAEEADTDVPYSTVRDYVSMRRRQIAAEAGAPMDGFIIRHNRPGADAEVDFGEVVVCLAGTMTRCHLFAFRLAYSGLAVHRVTVSCGQEAFLEGHEYAFELIGGIPVGQIRYDNLSSAVRRVVFRSRSRVENPRWEAFREHYGFTAFYCIPGLEGAHEKGGVEGQVGYYRRNRLTPVPVVATLEDLNQRLAAADLTDRERKIRLRSRTVGEDFAAEAALLGRLPTEKFGASLTLRPRVDREATVTVRMNDYSVPARFIGRKLQVLLGTTEVVVSDGRTEVARHPRLPGRGGQHLLLDHYLEILLRKPGALARSEALDQARREGTFTAEHEAFWTAAKAATGEDAAGTRELIQVLLLHRHMRGQDVAAGIRAALSVGTATADVVAVEARKAAQNAGRSPTITAGPPPAPPPPLPPPAPPPVTERTLQRVARLPADHRPPPDLNRWDQLLHHRRKESS
ncbi:transposase [Actinoplanes sp. SE50]|uniref:IS21 family transposase n=1 Tax=unclassified Actinoplanes TaxID=2626549 RepID=UPI00023ECE8D|nr:MULTISPECIES: IS21 family transposase [unclassified Actinoplanes]AEV84341.1 Transposase [Actinoplanes sp. SE50/110]ATO82733.1 transposase [Actinoplanes sp. SE50]SLM00140.1 transposase [Actinoplanes sp. SE50/110]